MKKYLELNVWRCHTIAFIILMILSGCGAEKKGNKDKEVDTSFPIMDVKPAIVETVKKEPEPKLVQKEAKPDGDYILIDEIFYFPETKEVYLKAWFRDEYDWKIVIDSLNYPAFCDKVISEGEMWRRSNLPLSKADEIIDLDLYEDIYIFNDRHENLGISKIKRVEYFEDAIESSFVIVFETQSELPEGTYYGIKGTTDFLEGLRHGATNNSLLDQMVKDHVNKASIYDWDLEHVLVEDYQTIYSFYSFASKEGELSYLLEIDEDKQEVKSSISTDGNYSIFHLMPVSLQMNGKPVLLLTVGMPETDNIWEAFAWFDGKKYRFEHKQKILFSFVSHTDTVEQERNLTFPYNEISLTIEDIETWDELEILKGTLPDSVSLYLELGETIEGRNITVDSKTLNNVIIEQRYETSVSIKNEGPHCDLTDWKHYYSPWKQVKQTANGQYLTNTYNDEDWKKFPEIDIESLKNEVKKVCEGYWYDHVKNVTFVTDYPASVGISRVYLRITGEKQSDGQKVTKLIVFNVPMGC